MNTTKENHLNEEGQQLTEASIPQTQKIHTPLFEKYNEKQIIQLFSTLLHSGNKSLSQQELYFISSIIPVLIYMRDHQEIIFDIDSIREYLVLNNIITLYKTCHDFPIHIRDDLKAYLYSLPGFDESTLQQNNIVMDYHSTNTRQLYPIFYYLKNLESSDFIIADKKWFYRDKYRSSSQHIPFGYDQELHVNFDHDDTYLLLHKKITSSKIHGLEDSWLGMPEYEQYILYLERNNQLETTYLSDLIFSLISIVSPYKQEKILPLVYCLLKKQDSSSDLSTQIQRLFQF